MSDVDQNLVLMRHSLCVCVGGGGGSADTLKIHRPVCVPGVPGTSVCVCVYIRFSLYSFRTTNLKKTPLCFTLQRQTEDPWALSGRYHTHTPHCTHQYHLQEEKSNESI